MGNLPLEYSLFMRGQHVLYTDYKEDDNYSDFD